MYNIYLELIGLMLVTSIACILPGTLLVARGVALMSDALSHAILPGIVIMFLLAGKLNAYLLLAGAALAGIATVIMAEAITQTHRLHKDVAIGIAFPLFFSVGIVLISCYARTIHLDMDIVILGHLIFAPLSRMTLGGVDMGPQALWTMSFVALLNGLLIYLWYKELLTSTFDPALAHTLGIKPSRMHYLVMIMTSITCVYAFDIVGSIVVVSLMIVPAAAASLFARSMHELMYYAIILGASATWTGMLFAHVADVSIAGSIATATGLIFLLMLVATGTIGYGANHQEADRIAEIVLCSWLSLHNRTIIKKELGDRLGWSDAQTDRIIQHAHTASLIYHTLDSKIYLTAKGRCLGQKLLVDRGNRKS